MESRVQRPIRIYVIGHAQGDRIELDEHDLPSWSFSESDVLVITTDDGAATPDVISRAQKAFASDPRTASVSLADAAVSALAGLRGRARLAEPLPHQSGAVKASAPAGSAVLINPAVLDLTGRPALGGQDGRTALLRWAQQANHRGLRHVWWWSGTSTESPPAFEPEPLDTRESEDSASPIGQMVDRHRATHDAITVTVDASRLGPHETGAQVATVHWLEALARRTDIARLTLVSLPYGALPPYAARLAEQPAIRVLAQEETADPADIFWRPSQPDARAVASRDRRYARRLVTTVLDLIEYSNERYHFDLDTWTRSREQTRRYLSQVDLVTGISDDVTAEVAAEVPGLEERRIRSTPLGVEHVRSTPIDRIPDDLLAAWPHATGSRFILVLGNDYMHKNRDFALRVWQEVADRNRVDLVLAGLHVRASSTKPAEDALLRAQSGIDQAVIRMPHVSSEAKRWFVSHATMVLYPSSAEGFGLVPHEAAAVGVPSLSTGFGPLLEFLPPEALVDHWSTSEYVRRVDELLQAAPAAAQLAPSERVRWI